MYHLPAESVTTETSLYALEDSLSTVELAMRIEAAFATPEWTLGDMVQHLDDRLQDHG